MSWKHRGFTPSVHSDSVPLLPLCFASITGCTDQTHQIIIKEGLPPKDVFQKWTEVDLLQKNPKTKCVWMSTFIWRPHRHRNWFTQLIFSTHSPRRNIISGVKKWIGVQNRERERKKDSSHFKTFFTCEAVVSNPLCLTIFHLHWWVKKKKLEFVVLFRKLIFKQAPVNSPCCSVFVWERLGAYLCLQRTTDRATPSQ